MLNQALKVFDFLKIKYPKNAQHKALYYMPLVIGSLAGIFCTLLATNSYGDNFLFSDKFNDLFTLLAILPGFFIASLSAVSAINRDAIDNYINHENPPFIWKKERNRSEPYKQLLTRRVFLTMLFAYLAAFTLLLTLLLTIIRFVFSADYIYFYFDITSDSIAPTIILLLFNTFVFSAIVQIVTLTLVGINYLGYKALVDE